jgi:thiol-disulfide isomerase/thioredoxin
MRLPLMGLFILVLVFIKGQIVFGQALNEGIWQVTMKRDGGLPVYFSMQVSYNPNRQLTFGIINANDTMTINTIEQKGDSLFFETPVFESRFKVRLNSSNEMTGFWEKGTASGAILWQFSAHLSEAKRIPGPEKPANHDISGRWQMFFTRKDGSIRKSVGIFLQKDSRVIGTILNPSGDYRYLEGAIRGDSLYLTTFDGSHSYAFVAVLPNDSTLTEGLFFGGTAPGEKFTAIKNAGAQLELSQPLTRNLTPQSFGFSLPDLDSNIISLTDNRFTGKVVIVQLMGSWCPNCMDETRYLSEFYNARIWPDVEMVALAYELSTNFTRSVNSLLKFQQKYQVTYPMLITGVTSGDEQKGQKTIPAFGEVRYFPTLLFIDKTGMLRKVHEGFYGPGAPDQFESFQKEFEEVVEALRKE